MVPMETTNHTLVKNCLSQRRSRQWQHQKKVKFSAAQNLKAKSDGKSRGNQDVANRGCGKKDAERHYRTRHKAHCAPHESRAERMVSNFGAAIKAGYGFITDPPLHFGKTLKNVLWNWHILISIGRPTWLVMCTCEIFQISREWKKLLGLGLTHCIKEKVETAPKKYLRDWGWMWGGCTTSKPGDNNEEGGIY